MRFLAAALLIIALIGSAGALETLYASNFSIEVKVSPEKDCFFAGDEVQITYTIYPKTSADKVKIGGEQGNPRGYYFKTSLLDARGTWKIQYSGAPYKSEDFGDQSFSVEVLYFSIPEQGKEGVDYISVNLTGKVPETNLRIKEIDAILATAEEAAKDALKPVTIRVVNKTAFLADLNSLKNKMSEVRNKLESEGVKYDEREFQNVEGLLSSAEKDLGAGNYLAADEKLRKLEEKILNLTNLADKLRAEEVYGKLSEIMSNISVKLEELQLLIQGLKGTENFTNFSSSYATLKSSAGDLRIKLQGISDYLEQEKFTKAYEECKKIEGSIYKLKDDIEKLYADVSASQKSESFDVISALSPYSIYIFAALLGVLLLFAATRFRRRRKWDELR
jgi:hypothetical protein